MKTKSKIDWTKVYNFKAHEFNDDKGECWIEKDLVVDLDRARIFSGTPYKITSACRNPEQNKKAGGKDTSSHLNGWAVDILADNSVKRFKIIMGLVKAGFTRIGIGKDFIHADKDPNKSPGVTWLYN